MSELEHQSTSSFPAFTAGETENNGTSEAGDLPYHCPECAKTFRTNKALSSHRFVKHHAPGTSKKAQHERKSKKPYHRRGSFTCLECGERFERPQTLGSHRAHHHGVPGSSSTAIANAKKKRDRGSALQPSAQTAAVLNHCPNCGLNLQIVARAVYLARRLQQ